MGKAAVDVAHACNYFGADTVEFILDKKSNFYFVEMNTRLQVEHPVTEMITGKDLVKEQILIARGEKLSFTQEDLKINGHAIELRVYAEDPENDFLPDIGKLSTYVLPQGSGVRVDGAFLQGMSIPVHYNPMISKLIVWGKNRDEAINRMTRAINEYMITGIETTLNFGKFVMNHEDFITGKFDTHFVKNNFQTKSLTEETEEEEYVAAIISGYFFLKVKIQNMAHLFKPKKTNGNICVVNKHSHNFY